MAKSNFQLPLHAPNLVIAATASDGSTYQKCAFNTQACEQLNAWLGGYESVLKRMTPSKFNWLIHAMLFYHTNHVIKEQKIKERKEEAENLDDDNEDISNDGLE